MTRNAGADSVPGWKKWVETMVVATTVPALGMFIRPDNPFFVNEPFCWPLLGVVIVGLRYGLSSAYVAGAIVLIGAVASNGATPSGSFVAGLVLLTLLAGEFGHRTRRHVVETAARARAAEARARSLLARHQALAASHTLLERASSSARPSLREALHTIQLRFGEAGELNEATAGEILELFAEFGAVSAASLLTPASGNAGALKALATQGSAAPVDGNAGLVRDALKAGTVAAVGPDKLHPDDDRLLVVVPLVDLEGKLHGIVAIHDMPFVALHEEALQLFAVLGGHLADLLSSSTIGEAATAPETAFSRSLRRSLSDLMTLQLPATLIRATVSGPEPNAMLSLIERQRRSIDRAVVLCRPNESELVFLLPLTDVEAAESCRQRMMDAIAADDSEELANTHYTLETIPLTENDDLGVLLAPAQETRHVVARRFGA